jgi:Tfp pilus assembly protein FimT
MLAKKRMEGAALELGTDLQYARSEAVQRNAPVGVVFDSTNRCYAIYAIGSTDATDCTTLGTGATALKTVQLAATGGSALGIAFTPAVSGAFIAFEPVRGTAADLAGVDKSGLVNLTSSAGSWQLRAVVTRYGRMKTCSPNSSVSGFSSDCT